MLWLYVYSLASQTYTHQLVSDASDLTLARPSPVSWKFASVDISSLGCCEGKTDRGEGTNVQKSIVAISNLFVLVIVHASNARAAAQISECPSA